MPPERAGTVPLQQLAQHAPGRPPVRAPELGAGRGRPQAPLLDQGPGPRPRVALEPAQVGGGGPAGDEQLRARVRRDRAQRRQAVADEGGRRVIRSGQPRRAARALEEHEVERRVDVHRQPPPRREVADGDGGGLREPARQRVVGGEIGHARRGPRPPRRSPRRPPSSDGSRARPDSSAAAARTNASRSPAVASGIDPAPRTTRPAGRSSATSRRRRAPNGVPSAGSRRTTASAAPAARKPSRWCSASAAQAASRSRTSGAGVVRGARVRG